MSNLTDLTESDGLSLHALSKQQIHDAHLTMIELGDFCEGDVTREEMADLLDMVTPTGAYAVTVLSNFDA